MKTVLTTIYLLLLCTFSLASVNDSINPGLNHEYFLKIINNSQTSIFNEVIDQYDAYLAEHPDDILVRIEKCKFVDYAMYDDYGEYNPNQELYDQLSEELFTTYPYHPDVLAYECTQTWGEDILEVLERAKTSIKDEMYPWSDQNIAYVYFQVAEYYYYDDDFTNAYANALIAGGHDTTYFSTVIYPDILFQLDRNEEAGKMLIEHLDTSADAWELTQRAELLLNLEKFDEAFRIYNLIAEKDSDYNNNSELAKIMNNYNRFTEARSYLLKDTSKAWGKSESLLALFTHDLLHHGGDTALTSYNAYRDLGYTSDPVGFYRLKLFFSHPLQAWKARDFLGVLTMLLSFILILLIPSIWILPIYFVGHHWRKITPERVKSTDWGLKSFWIASAAYFLASIIGLSATPEYLYSYFNDTNYLSDSIYSVDEESKSTLLFILSFGAIGISMLYKVNYKVLLYRFWSFWKCFGITAALFTGFKLASVIYVVILMVTLKVPASDFTFIPDLSLSAIVDVNNMIQSYGFGMTFLLVSVFVPIYEEIIFRGVILDACSRYLGFRWANFLQATLFAFVHGNLYLIPVYLGFGLLTGMLKKQSGGLLSGIAFHIVNNALALFIAYAKM
ncbi:MAG: CPBP family intramembrane metalloprotease [Flavobacteriales bacterium]|nr:CPBP family intramembrane metalloprotease [Flavobacteriales bacterium]